MALKQTQQLKLLQKLSPQQIQLMKLLQLPTVALEQRIKEELELNPALEEDNTEAETEEVENEYDEVDNSDSDDSNDFEEKEVDKIDDGYELEDYMDAGDLDAYKYEISNRSADDEVFQTVVVEGPDFHSQLEEQLGLRDLTEKQFSIGLYLIGCIDEDGYIRRDLDLIVDDLAFSQNIQVTKEELEEVLKTIQEFDPAGVGARTLQECLLIQLERKPIKAKETQLAIEVVKTMMDEFSKKHYDKIIRKLNIEDDDLKEVIAEITHLNPRPGNSEGDNKGQMSEVVPDFNISVVDGLPELSINQRNLPELKISNDYIEMLKEYSRAKEKSIKEASSFVKGKIESAQWFIEALQQRHQTMLVSMHAIMEYQQEYFSTGDESKIKPMILKDIADKVGLDISTVSRVANSKYVQTPYGTFLLKTFFSESLSTDGGEEVSTREVKKILQECIANEDKKKPLTDDALCEILREKKYNIARRTVAKYREQLDIPVARMRKEI
ncbi:MAG TPA: RNA polymerase factor sigma-54 [Bacteroidia bacterium]|nr:RNA polymerase factor sigma-54 [Bacteroidia bacterium]